MRTVEIKYAVLKDLDRMCHDLEFGKDETAIMRKWYFNSNEVWSGFIRERLACIYGITSSTVLSDTAYFWLTTNVLVHEHPFLFVRHSQVIARKLLESHRLIIGHVSAKSPDSIRWLEWLGVKLRRSETVNDMIPFELKRSA